MGLIQESTTFSNYTKPNSEEAEILCTDVTKADKYEVHPDAAPNKKINNTKVEGGLEPRRKNHSTRGNDEGLR